MKKELLEINQNFAIFEFWEHDRYSHYHFRLTKKPNCLYHFYNSPVIFQFSPTVLHFIPLNQNDLPPSPKSLRPHLKAR